MKTIKYILIALSVTAVCSCQKIVDKPLLDSFEDANFWTSESNVEQFCNYFYSEWLGYGNGTGTSAQFYFGPLNDNQWGSSFNDWSTKTVTASDGTWSSCYTEIRRANSVIEKVPGITSMTDEAKNHWIGVAKLYRAWQNYCLVRRFGDIVWVDKVLNVTEEDKDKYIFGERMDRDKVMDKVLEDLEFAITNIRESSSRTEYNKDVARAMASEICLYEGTFCKYRKAADGQKAPDATRANSYLEKCKTYSKAILDQTSKYELTSNYQAVYNSIDLAGNKEMILYKKYELNILAHSLIDYTGTNNRLALSVYNDTGSCY